MRHRGQRKPQKSSARGIGKPGARPPWAGPERRDMQMRQRAAVIQMFGKYALSVHGRAINDARSPFPLRQAEYRKEMVPLKPHLVVC